MTTEVARNGIVTGAEDPRTGVSSHIDQVRVAVIGCGAVSSEFHIPVLAGHEDICLSAFVDSDIERAARLARAYGVPHVFRNASELSRDFIDAALVATPPYHHAPCCMDLLARGIHVLVEKPMALTLADATSMVRAADEAGVALSVGLFRRLFPSVRLLRAAIEGGTWGRPVAFDVEMGSLYGWPLTTLSTMRKDQSGGGILMDMGPHVLDLVLFLLPGRHEVVEYRDNAFGGVETDCAVRLRITLGGRTIDGRIEMSRTRTLRNTVRIDCERGVLELVAGDRRNIVIKPDGMEFVDPLLERVRGHSVYLQWSDEPETVGFEGFRAEIDDWIAAIRTGRCPQLSAASVLPTVKLIEDCYARVRSLEEPWVQEGLNDRPTVPARLDADSNAVSTEYRVETRRKSVPPRRILITGATGFIGCRTAEILHLREGWQVCALVHNPASAARLARLPVEMVLGDLRSKQDILRAVEGCQAVVHCGIGTSWRRRERIAATVDGTRNVAEAALAAGVQRFVHLSSIAIHGNRVEGVLDESAPIRPVKGFDYGESKTAAEQTIARAAQAGLPAVTLRPAVVFGPSARTIVVRPLEHLKNGTLVLVACDDVPSNTVYVDNVVEAIVRALEAPLNVVHGQVFTIGAGDEFTWGEYFGYFARALGVQLRTMSAEEFEQSKPAASQPGLLQWARSWSRGCVEIATSPELRSLCRRIVDADPIGRFPRWLLEHPVLRPSLHRLLKLDTPVIYRRPDNSTGSSPDDLFTVDPIRALVSTDKARSVLGFAPVVSRERAMALTLSWLRYARLTDSAR